HEFEYIISYYADRDKYGKAIQAADIASHQHPQSIELKFKKAEILIDKGDFEHALLLLQKIERINSGDTEIYFLKGRVYMEMGKTSDALKNFDMAVESAFDETGAILYDIADILQQLNHYKHAIRYLKKGHTLEPKRSLFVYELAYCHERIDQYDASIHYYKKYLNLEPFNENVWYNLGTVYGKNGNLEKAIEAYEFALAIEPEFSPALYNKGNTYVNLGNYMKAIEAYREFLKVEEDENPEILCYIGECFEKLKRYKTATGYYQRAIQSDPEYSDAHFGLGIVLQYQGETEKCFIHIHRAIELDDENPEFWFGLGNVYKKTEQLDLALEAYKKATQFDPYDYESWLSISDIYLARNEIEQAVSILNESYHYNFDVGSLNYRLAALHFITKKDNLGFKFFEKGLMLDFSSHDEIFKYYPKAEKLKKVKYLINHYKSLNNFL
ncbi:MAG: tetratricopeptide repeat protein, partial [Bacteroidota bacterium]